MVTGAMNINIDLGCSRAIAPEMVPSHILGPDFTMLLDGSSGHCNLYDLGNIGSSITLGYQHGFRY